VLTNDGLRVYVVGHVALHKVWMIMHNSF
jgi:hypothetical protein